MVEICSEIFILLDAVIYDTLCLSLSLSVCTLCAMLAYYAYMYDMYFVCVGMHTSVTHYNLELEETAYDS